MTTNCLASLRVPATDRIACTADSQSVGEAIMEGGRIVQGDAPMVILLQPANRHDAPSLHT